MPHASDMKRLLLLALFAVGCDDGYLTGDTEWRVQLGTLCSGSMQLDGLDPTQDQQLVKFEGTWTCDGWYAGRAVADLRENGMMFLDLETTPGAFRGVRAQYTGGSRREIIGEMLIAVQVPFAAYMK
jgi:hypothetical protein